MVGTPGGEAGRRVVIHITNNDLNKLSEARRVLNSEVTDTEWEDDTMRADCQLCGDHGYPHRPGGKKLTHKGTCPVVHLTEIIEQLRRK